MPGPALLRAELEERGLSPLKLAHILGIQCRTVREVLRGDQNARLRDIALVAGALGFSAGIIVEARTILDDLIEPKETKKPRRTKVKWR
jgi:transcriptional regulator with XRE-family HTH domain